MTNELDDDDSKDTVGAVAMDFDGNCAAATSTGGLNGKSKGRVGDSPLVGAGLYADNQLGKGQQQQQHQKVIIIWMGIAQWARKFTKVQAKKTREIK